MGSIAIFKSNPSAKEQAIALLKQGYPMTCRELANRLGLKYTTVRANMFKAHKNGEVHITAWRKAGNQSWAQVWSYGNRADTPHPAYHNKPLPASPRKQSISEKQQDLNRLTRNYVQSERVWGI